MKGFFLIIDIAGFSKIIKNLDDDELNQRIGEWVQLIEDLAHRHDIKHFQTLSDTLMVYAPDSKEDFNKILDFCVIILQTAAHRSLLLRGAITYGEINWAPMIYGKTVIWAHQLEQSQEWIGITCHISVLERFKNIYSDFNQLICYAVPKKTGDFSTSPTIKWDIPDPEILINLFGAKGLAANGECLQWEVMNKINNTLLYREYCLYIKKNNLSRSLYHYKVCPTGFLMQ